MAYRLSVIQTTLINTAATFKKRTILLSVNIKRTEQYYKLVLEDVNTGTEHFSLTPDKIGNHSELSIIALMQHNLQMFFTANQYTKVERVVKAFIDMENN